MKEIWKDIEGYEGLYQVSNLGRVKSLGNNKSRKEKILKLRKNNKGYNIACLYKNNVKKYYSVHRIVANTFLENPNNYPCVNHKDENPLNNSIYNLEYCSYKYNNTYGTRIERFIKSKSISIYCIERDKFYNSIKQASKELNIKSENIIQTLKGRQKQAKGYTFRYANQVLYIGGN